MIKFVEEKEGLGFAEAVELLADRYGVELEREQEDPRAEAKRQQRRRLERAARPHRRLLRQLPLGVRGGGQGARVPGASAGWARRCCAPSASATRRAPGTRCSCAASGPGSRSRSCAAVGLVQRGRGGGEYDRFRSRIMFPIRDRRGRTLGFGGRAMRSDQGAKYVNTAETDFFHKSQMLYGVDLAKAAIAKAARAVVVEGYTDVLALHQAGIEEAVGGDGHGDHRASRWRRSRGWSTRSCWRSTPTRPGRRRCCGRSGSPPGARCGCGWRRCRPARTRPR